MENCLIFGLGGYAVFSFVYCDVGIHIYLPSFRHRIGSVYGHFIQNSGKAQVSAVARSNYDVVKEKAGTVLS